MFKQYSNSFRKAVDRVFGDEYPEMADRLRANVTRFSAYKANYVRQAFDDNARQFSGKELDEANRATVNQFRQWTDAELTTTVARARTAKQFSEYNEPDRKELFPCLKWLPSRAANPRQSHQMFWGGVWRKDDDFWKRHQPGTEWNCTCDLEECDDAPKTPDDYSPEKEPKLPKGFEPEPYGDKGEESNNPYHTGKVFGDNVGYIRNAHIGNKEVNYLGRDQLRADYKNISKSINNELGRVLVDSLSYSELAQANPTEKAYWQKIEIARNIDQYLNKLKFKNDETIDLSHNKYGSKAYKRKKGFIKMKKYLLTVEKYTFVVKMGEYPNGDLMLYTMYQK